MGRTLLVNSGRIYPNETFVKTYLRRNIMAQLLSEDNARTGFRIIEFPEKATPKTKNA
jgi:hypothetical protein